MRKKDILAMALARSGMLRSMRALRRPVRRVLILAYHRIVPLVASEDFPFDLELISATPEEFDWQVAFLVRHFNVVPLSQVAESLPNLALLPRDPVVLTFDDGFADNYEFALPVLRRHGVSATIFLSTDFIGATAPIWYELVAFLLLRAAVGTLPAPIGDELLPTTADVSSRRADLLHVLSVLKLCSEDERVAYLARMRMAAGPELLMQAENGMSLAMTWDQAREMSLLGVDFGSHTVTHPILTRVSEVQLERELRESKLRIEAELGRPIETIAYPVGGATAFDARVCRAVADAGYAAAVSYLPGENRLEDLEPLALRRIAIERYTTRERFAAMMTAPSVFGDPT